MALPKRRHSRTRGAKRRTHWKLVRTGFMACSNCHQPRRPHRICAHCGHYDGRQVVQVAES